MIILVVIFFFKFNLNYCTSSIPSQEIKLKFQKKGAEEVKNNRESRLKFRYAHPPYRLHPLIYSSIHRFVYIYLLPFIHVRYYFYFFFGFFLDPLWHFYYSFLFQKSQEEKVFLLYKMVLARQRFFYSMYLFFFHFFYSI